MFSMTCGIARLASWVHRYFGSCNLDRSTIDSLKHEIQKPQDENPSASAEPSFSG